MTRTALNRGDYLMNKAAFQLEMEGWLVEKAKKVRWSPQDFFGLWDIVAVKNGEVKFVQVSAKADYDKGKAWRQAAKDFPHKNKEYWWGQKGKGFKIIPL